MPQLVDAPWVAQRLGVSLWTVHSLARRGHLPAIRVGHRRKFDPATIEGWIRKGGTARAPEATGDHV